MNLNNGEKYMINEEGLLTEFPMSISPFIVFIYYRFIIILGFYFGSIRGFRRRMRVFYVSLSISGAVLLLWRYDMWARPRSFPVSFCRVLRVWCSAPPRSRASVKREPAGMCLTAALHVFCHHSVFFRADHDVCISDLISHSQ